MTKSRIANILHESSKKFVGKSKKTFRIKNMDIKFRIYVWTFVIYIWQYRRVYLYAVYYNLCYDEYLIRKCKNI
jgi:hypothetical protein